MKILIVKHGALGDVLRMSYFPKSIKAKFPETEIFWLTKKNAIDILEHNPYIDMVETDINIVKKNNFDTVYSFDDEFDIVKNVSGINCKKIVGAYFEGQALTYSEDVSVWFDMGLLSKYGKNKADFLKRNNNKTYGEIFSKIFDVSNPKPQSYFNLDKPYHPALDLQNIKKIGINPYAGGRWPSKTLRDNELINLISLILRSESNAHIFLFGMDDDRSKNIQIQSKFSSGKVHVADTNSSLHQLASNISRLDALISSDSLGMHMAISHEVPFVAFFTSTSAAEIDDYGLGRKIKSSMFDYCSYRKDADNSTITAEKIFIELASLKVFQC